MAVGCPSALQIFEQSYKMRLSMLIPTFPKFSPLTIDTKKDVEHLTKQFEPYSDFNFTSLLCWNTDGSTSVSHLNNNLIVKFPDYVTNEPVYTFIGSDVVTQSLTTILKTVGKLELVPESVIEHIEQPELFKIEEDEDQFDYIYSTAHHADLAGGHFKNKRKLLGRFIRKHGHNTSAEEIDLRNPATREHIEAIFEKWVLQKATSKSEADQERIALKRLVEFSEHLDISGHIVRIDGEPAGFSITESLGNKFAIYHFQKTLKDYDFLDIHLTRISSEQLFKNGAHYINWEQDLGIPGLRQAKTNYKPIRMLKKYSIELA